MLDIWRQCRPGGMSGFRHLPFSGGAAEQGEWMTEALNFMSAIEARQRRYEAEQREKRNDG